MRPWAQRSANFCERFGLKRPVCLAPMAGVPAPALSIAVGRAGGMGACGVLLMTAAEIQAWADAVRSAGPFQLNNWIPDPPPRRDAAHEQRVREFLAQFGSPVAAAAGDVAPRDFDGQCAAMLAARPAAISSIMGVYPPAFVAQMKQRGIAWFASVTTVAEAVAAADAGADVIVAQGAEAGGHRGAFDPAYAEQRLVGLFALLPAIADAVKVPVIATGGIADARGVAAAFTLGASAVQVGTAFLRGPESGIHPAWAGALAKARPEDTVITRAFSGRPGRSLANRYALAAGGADAPAPAPYPVQRGLTAGLRNAALKDGDIERMQAWSGQSAALGRAEPAAQWVERVWREAKELLG